MIIAAGKHSRWTGILLLLATAALTGTAPAQSLKITLLGTGTPSPTMERFGPSILVEAGEQKLLFDCGRGATQRIEQLKVPFAQVDALFLTHLHSDHVVGIPDLWLTGWIRGRTIPLRVWGPAGTKEMMSHLEQAYQFDIHIRRDVDEKIPAQGVVVLATDIEQGVVYENRGVKVTAFEVDHGPVKPAFGYRVDFAGHSVVLSGDTRFSENLIHFSEGADVLIHEVMDPDAFRVQNPSTSPERVQRILAHHTSPEQAGTVFARVKPKLAVYSHIVPPDAPNLVTLTRKTYSGSLEVGEDLMSIEIGEKVVVHRANPSAESNVKPLLLEKNEGELRTRRIHTDSSTPASSQFMLKVSPKNNGSQHLVAGTEELAAGAALPRHRHLLQDEILLIQSGKAHVWLGDDERDLHAGGLVFIPANTWVSAKNVGTEPISLTFIFSAPGFEDTMRCNSVAAGETPTQITPEQQRECAHLGHAENASMQEQPKHE